MGDRNSVCWVTTHMAVVAGAGPVQCRSHVLLPGLPRRCRGLWLLADLGCSPRPQRGAAWDDLAFLWDPSAYMARISHHTKPSTHLSYQHLNRLKGTSVGELSCKELACKVNDLRVDC